MFLSYKCRHCSLDNFHHVLHHRLYRLRMPFGIIS